MTLADAPALFHERVLESMDDGVVVVRFGGEVVTFNAAASRILGVDGKAIVGRSFTEALLPESGLDALTEMVLDAVSSQATAERQRIAIEVAGEERLLTVDTTYLRVGDGPDGLPAGIVAVFTDVTAVEALRESELQLGRQVRAQYEELQGAYRTVEERNEMLDAALRRVRVVQALAGAAVLAVFLFAGFFVWNAGEPDVDRPAMAAAGRGVAETVVTVVPERVLTTIAVTGRLSPRDETSVLSPVEATVRAVYFQYGDAVEVGRPLVALDMTKTRREHRVLRAEYIEATRRLRELENWEDGREMTAARRNLAKAAGSLEKQRHKIEETAFLLERGVIPAAEHDAAVEQYESLQADHEIAGQELDAVREQGGTEAMEMAQLAYDNLRDQIGALEAAIADDVVHAPVAGVIVEAPRAGTGSARLDIGTPLAAGDPVVKIADISTLRVAAVVDELDVADVHVGQVVTVTSDAAPELALQGEVTNVSSHAASGRRGSLATFAVNLSLAPLTDAQRRKLRLGMTVDARIVTRDRPDALLVPIRAVRLADGQATVRVREPASGTVRNVPVETGTTTVDRVEIRSGLAAGDEVLVPGTAS